MTLKTNFPEWDARQRDMRAREDFHRAPYGPEDFPATYEDPDLTPEILFERDYDDEDRLADMEMDAVNEEVYLASPTGMSDRSVVYYTALAAAYREKANGTS